jgi:hypothetical protein
MICVGVLPSGMNTIYRRVYIACVLMDIGCVAWIWITAESIGTQIEKQP